MASTGASLLARIVASKLGEIEESKARLPERELERQAASAGPVRDFAGALAQGPHVRLIAEVKKASPSAGQLRDVLDPVAIARAYADNGAAAISVLTDWPFFQGRLEYLSAIRGAVSLPLLRKDFLLDRYQLLQARAAGADAVLLIAEILDDEALPAMIKGAADLGLHALVELYDPPNLPRVLAAGARIVGINNRDLRTFATRLEHTLEIAPKVPPNCLLVSESGIATRNDIHRLATAGVRAVLIGEAFMRARDIGAKIRELFGDDVGSLPR